MHPPSLAPPLPIEPPALPPVQRSRQLSFWLGVILIALSFGIYPAYPMVAFVPISLWNKAGAAVGLSAVSWGMFGAGCMLVGKKRLAHLRRRFLSRWV
jgi:hypothetical protein